MNKPLNYAKQSVVGVPGTEGVAGGVKVGGEEKGVESVGKGVPDCGVGAERVEPGEPPGTVRVISPDEYQIKAMGEGWVTCKEVKGKARLRLADFYRSHHLE